jgi:competence protein ComEA
MASEPSRTSTPPTHPSWLLRRSDQAGVAALVLVALAAMAVWWVSQGGLTGRLVEVDHAPPQEVQFQVDINSADWPELVQLPGIGEKLAKRIVDSRQTDGPFLDHRDLMRVRGIGPKTLENVRPFLLPMAERGAVAGKWEKSEEVAD